MFFFFNDTATTEIYTLSLHDALPICWCRHEPHRRVRQVLVGLRRRRRRSPTRTDRKSTRLNSSHANISYAVFCLKKKKSKRQAPSDSPHDHSVLMSARDGARRPPPQL